MKWKLDALKIRVKKIINVYIVIALVGNKSDLYAREQVKEKEGKDFAKSIGILFKLTSCLNNSNVTELFEELGGIYLGLYSIKKLKKKHGKEENNY